MTYRTNVKILTRINKRDKPNCLGYSFWWMLLDALDRLRAPGRGLERKPKLCDYEMRRTDWIYSEWNADCPR